MATIEFDATIGYAASKNGAARSCWCGLQIHWSG
jgi:hypothetical protein